MATIAKPKALAMPSRSTALGPEPMPPTTAAPQPKNTRANVPINSATDLFTTTSLSLFRYRCRLLLPAGVLNARGRSLIASARSGDLLAREPDFQLHRDGAPEVEPLPRPRAP